MKNIMKIMMVLFVSLGVLYAQDKTDTSKKMKNHQHMMKNMHGHMNDSTAMKQGMMDMKNMPDSCKSMMKNMHGHMNDSTAMKHGMMDMKNMPDSCKAMMKNMDMKDMSEKCSKMMKSKKMKKQNMDMQNTEMKGMKEMHRDDSSIIRKGVIDLSAIDENKDGFVYQDHMDWNVISDKAGECPICGMTLKKVSLEVAKENLVKHGFKIK